MWVIFQLFLVVTGPCCRSLRAATPTSAVEGMIRNMVPVNYGSTFTKRTLRVVDVSALRSMQARVGGSGGEGEEEEDELGLPKIPQTDVPRQHLVQSSSPTGRMLSRDVHVMRRTQDEAQNLLNKTVRL